MFYKVRLTNGKKSHTEFGIFNDYKLMIDTIKEYNRLKGNRYRDIQVAKVELNPEDIQTYHYETVSI